MAKKFIRLPGVLDRAGVQKSKLWEMVKKEEFPQPIKLSPGTTVWIEEEVDQWVEDKISEYRGGGNNTQKTESDSDEKKPVIKRVRRKTGGSV